MFRFSFKVIEGSFTLTAVTAKEFLHSIVLSIKFCSILYF